MENALTAQMSPDLPARVRERFARAAAERAPAPAWVRALTASMQVPLVGAVVFLVAWTAAVVLLVRHPGAPPAHPASQAAPRPKAQPSPGTSSVESRSVSLEYRGLEGFRPVRTMTIEVLSKEGRP